MTHPDILKAEKYGAMQPEYDDQCDGCGEYFWLHELSECQGCEGTSFCGDCLNEDGLCRRCD